MLIGKSGLHEMHLYKCVDDVPMPATEEDVVNPAYKPMVVMIMSYMRSMSPLLYEDNKLYHIYNDAITKELIKEQVIALLDYHNKLIIDAEAALESCFKKNR